MKKKDGKKKGVAESATKKSESVGAGAVGARDGKERRDAERKADAIERKEDAVGDVAVRGVGAEAKGSEVAATDALTLEEATKKLENLRRTIRKLLNEQGKYRKELTYQVEVAASTLLAWRKVRDEAISIQRIVLRETSREGDERWKAHPIFEMYAKMTDVLRRDLRALQMNKEREKALEDDGEGGDGLTELMAALGEE